MLPGIGPFRWSFRWLPLVFLAGGLVAAGALQRLRHQAPPEGRPNLGLWALTGVSTVWLYALLRGLDPTAFTLWLGAAMTALCLGWAALERFCSLLSGPRCWAPALLTWATVMLFAVGMSPLLSTPVWSVRPEDLASQSREVGVRSWSVYTWADIVQQNDASPARACKGRGVELLPANFGMYTGADVVQGYSPQGPLGTCILFSFGHIGQVDSKAAERLLRVEAGREGLLAFMAVDALVLGNELHGLAPIVERQGWRAKADSGVRAFRRSGPPSPRVRSLTRAEVSGDRFHILSSLCKRQAGPLPLLLYRAGSPAESPPEDLAQAPLWGLQEERNRAVVQVGRARDRERESVIVFSRPWYPGYRAYLDGKPMPVEVLALTMPAVRLPPGSSGNLVLEYRPMAITIGGPMTALTAAFVVCAAVVALVRGRRAMRQTVGGSRRFLRPAGPSAAGTARMVCDQR
jgi:hypothetical protein